MHVRIFEPKPAWDRWNYWVVVFPDEGEPQRFDADSADAAERLAADLAEQHNCRWMYMPDYPDLPHWFDENGDIRDIDRVELVHLGNGRVQFNCWSGGVRLSTEAGEASRLIEIVRLMAEEWSAEHEFEQDQDDEWKE